MVGMSMTYTLFEWAKENLETLLEAQPESLVVEAMERIQVTMKHNHQLIYLDKPPPHIQAILGQPRLSTESILQTLPVVQASTFFHSKLSCSDKINVKTCYR